jgi:hypothetical protein
MHRIHPGRSHARFDSFRNGIAAQIYAKPNILSHGPQFDKVCTELRKLRPDSNQSWQVLSLG